MKGAENYFADSKELNECANRLMNRELTAYGKTHFSEPKPNSSAKSMDSINNVQERKTLAIHKERNR